MMINEVINKSASYVYKHLELGFNYCIIGLDLIYIYIHICIYIYIYI